MMRRYSVSRLFALAALACLAACGPTKADDGDDGGGDGDADGGDGDADGGDGDADGGDGDADGGDGDADGGDGDGDGDWAACSVPTDCVLAFNTCCGTCDVPTLEDFDAINASRSDDHFAEICPDQDPICPGCAAAPNPWLGATCTAGTCEGFDLEEDPLNTCTADTDCRLRAPGCCECGAPTDVWSIIALPDDAFEAYRDLVCEPDQACDLCAPTYPDELSAVCDDGHCAVEGR